MKTELLVISLFLLFACNLAAQDYKYVNDLNSADMNYKSDWFESSSTGFDDVKGSQYLNEQFSMGYLITNDSSKIEGLDMRYNILLDEIEVLYRGDTFLLNKPMKLKRMFFDGSNFVYAPILTKEGKNGRLSFGYFESLNEGPVQLMVRHSKSVKLDSYASNYMGGGGTGQKYLRDHLNYYLKRKGEAAVKLFRSKKKILSFLDDESDLLKKYIKEKKLKMSKTQDILKVILYYNSLVDDIGHEK